MRQNRHCLVKLWKCQKAVSTLPHEGKRLLQLYCLKPIIFGWRQNSFSGAFASWIKIKIHYFTWADQDWIRLMIFKNFVDQDWTRTEKFHSLLTSSGKSENSQVRNFAWHWFWLPLLHRWLSEFAQESHWPISKISHPDTNPRSKSWNRSVVGVWKYDSDQRLGDCEIFQSESNPDSKKIKYAPILICKFLKIISPIQSWSVHVKTCILMLPH